MKVFSFISLVCFFIANVNAQQKPWRDSLVDTFILKFDNELPYGKYINEKEGISAIEKIDNLNSHENARIRSYAHFKVLEIGIKNKSNTVKSKSVSSILRFSYDPDIAIRGNNANFYEGFPKEAFNADFIVGFRSVLHNDSFVNRGHILLVGFLEIIEEKAYLKSRFIHSKERLNNDYSRKEINTFDFAARMALARMGEKEQVDYVIRKIKDEPEKAILRDRMNYLAYIKRPEAVEIMFDYLFMDKFLKDVSGFERTYANYVIPYIYQSVEDFPISNNGWFGYSEEEIEVARRWVTANRNNYVIDYDTWGINKNL
jgi:hypothetical protein